MARRSCDGAGFLAAFRSAVASLEANVDEINALNVFPVPDGDTGTNMLATVRAALEEADKVGPDAEVAQVAQAASFGALMGARGNSGVITSQILAGMAHGLAGKRRFNGLDLAHALDEGTKTAYKAVAKPVEGTILTVIREASAAAVAAAERDNDVEAVLAATVDAAERAVAKTPSLLPILREAHVVDSGGQGLFRLFQGALEASRGRPVSAGGGAAARPARPRGAARGARPRCRGGRVRVRDGVPAPRPGRRAARHPGDPGPPRGHRRLGAGRGRRPARQGPRPQRASRRGHRVRPLDRDAVADHDREPRQPGPRRPGDEGGGVRGVIRAVGWAERRGPRDAASARGRGRRPIGRAGGRPHRHRGPVPGARRLPRRPGWPEREPVDGRAARGGRGDPGGRAADPVQQPERRPRRAPGRRDDQAHDPGGPDAELRRGRRGPVRARPDHRAPRPTPRR